MKLAARKGLELDDKVKEIIDEEFADFEKYMPTPQDRKMYQRKRTEYWNNIQARLKETNYGRTDDTDSTAING